MSDCFLITMYERDIIIHTVVTCTCVRLIELVMSPIMQFVKAKIVNTIYLPEYVLLGGNSSIYNRINVVHLHVKMFVKNSPSVPQQCKRNQI